MQEKQEWAKVLYEDANGKTGIKQGYLLEEGNFFRITGDNSETLIRKDKITTIIRKRGQDGRTKL